MNSLLLILFFVLSLSTVNVVRSQDTPTGAIDTPTGATDTPTGAIDTPTGATDTPTGAIDTPTGVTDTPTGVIDTPTGVTYTPTGAIDTPTGVTDTPTGAIDTPTGVTDTPTTETAPEAVPEAAPLYTSDALYLPSPSSKQCLWTYTDTTTWTTLDCDQTCDGTMQSPVQITSYVPDPNLPPLEFTGYGEVEATLVDKGYTIEVEFPENYDSFFLDGFFLKQFHIHTPAENNFFGTADNLTVHMVHKSDNGEIAVLTILFTISTDPSSDNPLFVKLIETLSSVSTTQSQSFNFVGFTTIFSHLSETATHGYVSFKGSLTTPPCTEGVHWNILLQPQLISQSQYDVIHARTKTNVRPVQRKLRNVSAFVPNPYATPELSSSNSSDKKVTYDPSYMVAFWIAFVLLLAVSVGLVVILVTRSGAKTDTSYASLDHY